ncbi:MAG: SdrD B-like domain-containing protein, partial [Phaeodactylibacter sp.]|uniref:HYR-like domain-containing protein n=1 Tax=Phaeodactylibacter sp. TaxID=1940289 RepID=UPI0032EDE257
IFDEANPVIVPIDDYQLAVCNADWPVLVTVWTSNCSGGGNVTGVPGTVSVAGCLQSRVYTFMVNDDCGAPASAFTTVTRVVDETPPTILNPADFVLPGCNPAWPSEVLAGWVDNCSAGGALVGVPGPIITNGCSQSRAYTFSVVDDCGNASNAVTLVTRQYEETAPEITPIEDIQLALCNAPWPPSLSTTWTDGCTGGGTVEALPGGISTLDCIQTRVYTFSVTSECGNSAQAEVLVTRVFDETGPVFGPIEPFTVQCDLFDAIPPPSVTDNCSLTELSFTDEVVAEICNYTFIRTWVATDACFNTTTAEQIINVVDTVGPVFENIEEVITVACIEDIPISNPTVYDECSGAFVDYQLLTIDGGGNPEEVCVLTTAIGAGADWALWLPAHYSSGFSASANFVFDANGGTFDQFENGTAHLYGTVVNDINPAESYILDFWFENKRDWAEWSALGRSYKDDAGFAAASGDLWTTWSYYELANNFSTATGTGDLAGNVLYFQHAPASYFFGFQVGVAANNKNANYGMSGWFTYTGVIDGATVNGHGDVNVDGDCVIQQNETCANNITYINNYLAFDDCFNSTAFTQLIIVNDTIAPQFIDLPADILISCEEWPVVVPDVAAIDNCDGDVTLEVSTQTDQGDCEGNFVVTYTWVATDSCGNSSLANWVVTVLDTISPSIASCPDGGNYVCLTDVPVSDATLVSATDNCSEVTITHFGDVIEGDDCSGVITRTYRAYDECGNFSDCVQVLTYNDTIAPVFDNIPENMVASCENVPAISDVTASDNCGPDEVVITVQESLFSGGCSGVLQRIYTATDVCGNTVTFEHYITLVDTVAPVLANLPADAVYECDEDIPAPADVTALDNCDDSVTIDFDETSEPGACPQAYTIYRTWTATDACENTDTYTQVITIADETAPTFDIGDDEITVSCDMPTIATPVAMDNCGPEVPVSLETQTIPGNCPNEWTDVYTWTATDSCGNSASVTLTVNYVDEDAPVFTMVPGAIDVASGDQIPDTEATAEDNCGSVTLTFEDSDLIEEECQTYIIRTFTAEDLCQNTETATQIINIVDSTAPMVVCPPDQEVTLNSAPVELSGAMPSGGVYSGAGVSDGLFAPAVAGVGVHELTYTYTDAAGCARICTFTITVTPALIAELGDFVWLDVNQNGQQDSGEPGLPGVEVILERAEGGTFLQVETTATDGSGHYRFVTLPGTYRVQFISSGELTLTMPLQGEDTALDSDALPNGGFTAVVTLAEGEINLTIDAGFFSNCDNVTIPGEIGPDQYLCAPGNTPAPIESLALPEGGSGGIEYIWMRSAVAGPFNLQTWTLIPGSNTPDYAPGPLSETTYFARCARREDCALYLETNIVTIEVGNETVAEISGPEVLCVGESATFTATAAGPGALYEWSMGLGLLPTSATGPVVTLSAPYSHGSFDITLSVTVDGCTATQTRRITATHSPLYCGTPLPLSAHVLDMQGVTYVKVGWMAEELQSGFQYTLLHAGPGEASLSPIADYSEPQGMIGTKSYYEYLHERPTAGVHQYQVVIQGPNGRPKRSELAQVVVGAEPLLFPNPAGYKITVMLPGSFYGGGQLKLLNAQGQVLQDHPLNSGELQVDLDLSRLAVGAYFVLLQDENGNRDVLPFMKQ